MVVQLFSRSIESQLGRCKKGKSYSSSRIGRGFFCASFCLHATKLDHRTQIHEPCEPLRACPCTLKQLPVSCRDMNWVREFYNSKFETLLRGWGCATGLTSYPAPKWTTFCQAKSHARIMVARSCRNVRHYWPCHVGLRFLRHGKSVSIQSIPERMGSQFKYKMYSARWDVDVRHAWQRRRRGNEAKGVTSYL